MGLLKNFLIASSNFIVCTLCKDGCRAERNHLAVVARESGCFSESRDFTVYKKRAYSSVQTFNLFLNVGDMHP